MEDKSKKIGLITALLSIMAAAFGVQKRRNMERDLNATNPIVYVVAALIFVICFIAAILVVVNLVIPEHLT